MNSSHSRAWLLPMNPNPEDSILANALEQLNTLPPELRIRALLDAAGTILAKLDIASVQEVRAIIAQGFPEHPYDCACATCGTGEPSLLTLIDGHLAMRQLTDEPAEG